MFSVGRRRSTVCYSIAWTGGACGQQAWWEGATVCCSRPTHCRRFLARLEAMELIQVAAPLYLLFRHEQVGLRLILQRNTVCYRSLAVLSEFGNCPGNVPFQLCPLRTSPGQYFVFRTAESRGRADPENSGREVNDGRWPSPCVKRGGEQPRWDPLPESPAANFLPRPTPQSP